MSTKRDQAYSLLLERINNGTYPAQAYIDDKAIALELETSRCARLFLHWLTRGI